MRSWPQSPTSPASLASWPWSRARASRCATKLGTRPAGAQDLSLIANVQPPNVDIARRIGFALDAMQHYDAARARDELLEAIAEAPALRPGLRPACAGLGGVGIPGKIAGRCRAGRALGGEPAAGAATARRSGARLFRRGPHGSLRGVAETGAPETCQCGISPRLPGRSTCRQQRDAGAADAR